ncbi:MAG: PDZ domain-containing protein [Sandaracinus sp.]|nr:PDZ domain-containing protein [Sandaracinus sp.]MCB9634415.1 PDZ domain-containing protein [Sandaracinus sp.]
MRVLLILVACLAGLGCAYPRRSTSLCPATTDARPAPSDIWRLAFSTAVIPPRQRGDQPWDEDGTPPDVFVRVYRGDELLFESEPVEGLQPALEATTPNLHLPTNTESRIELWDADGVLPTVIGIWRGQGLPSGAMEDGDTRIMLDGNATVGFRVLSPEASRGAGIPNYEVRRKELRLIEVLEHSPAGRAGLVPGDAITAIGGETVEDLGEARAAGALSRACSEATRLTVRRADGRVEDLVLDRGFVWTAL